MDNSKKLLNNLFKDIKIKLSHLLSKDKDSIILRNIKIE